MMELVAAILSSISIANIIILASLIGLFLVSYAKTRAQIPLAMSIFCSFLILHNVIGAQAYFTSVHLFSQQLFPYLIGIHATELAGLLVFLKISYQ